MFVCLCVVCVSKWDSKGKGLYTDMFGVCVCACVCVVSVRVLCATVVCAASFLWLCMFHLMWECVCEW